MLGRELRAGLPAPIVDLDPVAAVLWTVDVPWVGLPVVLRALASWWRVQESADPAGSPEVLAAAVLRLVSVRAGGPGRYDEVAAAHGVDPVEVRTAGGALQRRLRLSPVRLW